MRNQNICDKIWSSRTRKTFSPFIFNITEKIKNLGSHLIFLYKLARKRFSFIFGDIKLCSNDGEYMEDQRTRINCFRPQENKPEQVCVVRHRLHEGVSQKTAKEIPCCFCLAITEILNSVFLLIRKNISKLFFNEEIIPEPSPTLISSPCLLKQIPTEKTNTFISSFPSVIHPSKFSNFTFDGSLISVG